MKLIARDGMWCVEFEDELGVALQQQFGSNVLPLPFNSTVLEIEAIKHLEKYKDSFTQFILFPDGNSQGRPGSSQ